MVRELDKMLRILSIPAPTDSYTATQRLLWSTTHGLPRRGEQNQGTVADIAGVVGLDMWLLLVQLFDNEWETETDLINSLAAGLRQVGEELTARDAATIHTAATAAERARWFARHLISAAVDAIGDRYIEVHGVSSSLRLIHEPMPLI